MNEEIQNILTIDELKNYIGKPIVCYYYKDYITEFRDHEIQRELPEDDIMYMWMFVLTEIEEEEYKDNTIRGKTIYGKNIIVLIDSNGKILRGTKPHIISRIGSEKEPSSAQAYIRTPTKRELITYMNIFRHRRIFGY